MPSTYTVSADRNANTETLKFYHTSGTIQDQNSYADFNKMTRSKKMVGDIAAVAISFNGVLTEIKIDTRAYDDQSYFSDTGKIDTGKIYNSNDFASQLSYKDPDYELGKNYAIAFFVLKKARRTFLREIHLADLKTQVIFEMQTSDSYRYPAFVQNIFTTVFDSYKKYQITLKKNQNQVTLSDPKTTDAMADLLREYEAEESKYKKTALKRTRKPPKKEFKRLVALTPPTPIGESSNAIPSLFFRPRAFDQTYWGENRAQDTEFNRYTTAVRMEIYTREDCKTPFFRPPNLFFDARQLVSKQHNFKDMAFKEARGLKVMEMFEPADRKPRIM